MSALSTVIGRGTNGARPAAGNTGRLYYDTTNSQLQRDNGSSWDSVEAPSGSSDLAGFEKDYAQFTSPVTVSATSEATADTIVTGNSVAYDGSTVVMVEFYAPYFDSSGGARILTIVLYDGSSSIGKLGVILTLSGTIEMGSTLQRRLTPSNASHTYSVRGYINTGTAPVGAGAGGSTNYMPGFIRITKV